MAPDGWESFGPMANNDYKMKSDANMGVWLNSTATAYRKHGAKRGIHSGSNCNGVNASMQTTSAYLNRYAKPAENQIGYNQRTASSFGSTTMQGAMCPVGTGSFVAINEQMEYGVVGYETVEESAGLMRAKRPGGDEAIGQLVPIGDMVVPMLVCAMVYAATKAIRKIVKQSK